MIFGALRSASEEAAVAADATETAGTVSQPIQVTYIIDRYYTYVSVLL